MYLWDRDGNPAFIYRYYKWDKVPRNIRWTDLNWTDGEMGFRDDGVVVWRKKIEQ